MDKIITISKDNTDSIILKVNEVEKIRVPKDNREINAKEIYDCFSYEKGDTYRVEQLEENISDNDVLKTFINLITQIAQSLSELSDSSDDSNTVSDEAETEKSE